MFNLHHKPNCCCVAMSGRTYVRNAFEEELADTEGVTRIRKSKKNRQNNGQKKKEKRTNNDLQNIHIELKIG